MSLILLAGLWTLGLLYTFEPVIRTARCFVLLALGVPALWLIEWQPLRPRLGWRPGFLRVAVAGAAALAAVLMWRVGADTNPYL